MAAKSNTGFPRHEALPLALNRHAMPFQQSPSSEMIPMMGYFGGDGCGNDVAGVWLPGSSRMINSSNFQVQVQVPPGSSNNNNNHNNNNNSNSCPSTSSASASSSSILLDSVTGLKHDTGLAVEWSVEEQYKLEEGLVKFADEPSIMRYIKIAATLRDKTVRDVALRCRWMTRKRRKADEYNAGKKVIIRKDKMVESSSKINVSSALPQKMAVYPFMMHHLDQTEPLSFEGVSGTARHLLEQNAQAFSQITANLSTFKLQDNINLFCHTRDNIAAILNDMREMPGIMSQMPPLPVTINEDLANSILPNTTHSMMFSASGIQLKQEPRC